MKRALARSKISSRTVYLAINGPVRSKGKGSHKPVKRPRPALVVWAAVTSFLGIFVLAEISRYLAADYDGALVIGAFGASAVLLFGAPGSPLAQPFNLVVGHVMSALIGVAAFHAVGQASPLAMALAVSLAIGAMQLTRSVHPPGGASALIAVIGSDQIHALGYTYAVLPVGIGALILLGVALATNNVLRNGPWPLFWLPFSLSRAKLPLSRAPKEQAGAAG